MKKIFYAILLGFISLQVSAQNYSYVQVTGGTVAPYSNSPVGTPAAILQVSGSTIYNQLSNSVSLPFTWYFYGNPVTSFKASSSGYITFDPNATQAVSINTPLDSSNINNTGAPNNSIFALWANWDLRVLTSNNFSCNVLTWTVGPVGNRIFYIEWDGSSNHSVSASNVCTYLLRIFETGGFDIVYNWQDGNIGTIAGTVGTKNADGTKTTSVTGSPSFNFPVAYSGTAYNGGDNPGDDVIYRFGYPAEPSVDLSIQYFAIPEETVAGGNSNATLYVEERGSSYVSTSDYTVNYSINGGTPVSAAGPFAINANGIVGFYMPISVPAAGQSYQIKIWVSASKDSIYTNDTVSGTTFGIMGTSNYLRHPMIEDFTDASCEWCPYGLEKINGLLNVFPDAIVVAIHSNIIGPDAMENSTGEAIRASLGINSLPSIDISRDYWPTYGSTNVSPTPEGFQSNGDPVYLNNDTNVILTYYAYERDSTSSPAHMDFHQTYDATTRQLSVTLTPKFSDYVLNYKLYYNVYLVQDTITGSGLESYGQLLTPYGWADPTMEFYHQGSYYAPFNQYLMSPFTHHHVFLTALAGSSGQQSSLGSTYNFDDSTVDISNYSFTLPTNWKNVNGISVIGFAYYSDPTNLNNTQEIIAANEIPITATVTGIEPVKKSITVSNIYPNPNAGEFTADVNFQTSTNAYFEVTDIAGKTLMTLPSQNFNAGSQALGFDMTSLTPGIYFLTVKSDVGTSTQKFVVTK